MCFFYLPSLILCQHCQTPETEIIFYSHYAILWKLWQEQKFTNADRVLMKITFNKYMFILQKDLSVFFYWPVSYNFNFKIYSRQNVFKIEKHSCLETDDIFTYDQQFLKKYEIYWNIIKLDLTELRHIWQKLEIVVILAFRYTESINYSIKTDKPTNE